jgi:hypothetical protein
MEKQSANYRFYNVEMRIPYAALRFSAEKKQTKFKFSGNKRSRQKIHLELLIDSKLTFYQQTGILEGIANIFPPAYFLCPILYVNANARQNSRHFERVLDIKYGINDAFTLGCHLDS